MELLKYLKSAAKSNTSVRTKYLQQYNEHDSGLHVFYEGNDDPSFYSNFFEHRNKIKIYYYQAENKKGVYEVHAKINWEIYNKSRSLFFVDKDFADILKEVNLKDTNIFVTKYYSIENYIVCKSMFIRIFRDILHIDEDKFINKCYKDFGRNLALFAIQVQPLIAWILSHRSIKSSLQLSNFKISDLFSFNNDLKITRNRSCNGKKPLEYIRHKTKLTHIPESWKGILDFYRQLKKIHSHKTYLRGKYEIWFLVAYVNKLVEIINDNKAAGEPKIKVQFNLSADNAIELLGPRLKKPADINKFLNSNKK